MRRRPALLAVVGVSAWALSTARPARADGIKACDAAYEQAQTLRDGHKLVAAREALRVCARPPCPGFMSKDCTTWLSDVEARIPSVVFVARGSDGEPLPQASVSIDGAGPPRLLDGKAWDIEPGSHTFTFVAPGGRSATKQALVVEGTRDQSVVVTFEPVESTAPAPPPPPPSSSPVRPAGYAVGGVGVAALVAGAILGGVALSTKAAHCDAQGACTGGYAHTALEEGTFSTVSLVAGGAFVAAGLLMVLLAPGPKSPPADAGSVLVSPFLAHDGGGASILGRF